MKILLFLVLFCLSLILATNPGFKARITQDGLNYANKMAMMALSVSIRSLKIPDQSGKSGKVSFTLSGMQIRGFTPPSSSMTLYSSGIKWAASGAGMSMHGNFGYKYKKGWIKISDHGSFDASLSSVSFSLTIGLTDSSGKPRLSGSGCNCGIGGVKVRFHGGASWIYNLFSHYISGKVKDLLRGKMCDLVVQAINTDANKQLAKLPMDVVVARKFLLDYSLNSNPSFNSKYMETFHKGEVYWNGDKTESPFTPSPLPTSTDTSKMLYLWVSDYMGNSLGYTGYKHGFLRYNLTAKDLPAANRSLLNTTCSGMKCIGGLIPGIGKKYPHTTVMFHMHATAPPKVTITKGVISMNFSGDVDLYAQTTKGSPPLLLTITCVFVTNVTASIQGQLLKGKITSTKLKVGVKNSTVGPVPTMILQIVMDAAINGFVVPKLNAAGQKGLVLPVTANIRFSRAQLSLLKGAVLIATDLSYLSDAQLEAEEAEKKSVLRNTFSYRHGDPELSFQVIGEKNVNAIFDQI